MEILSSSDDGGGAAAASGSGTSVRNHAQSIVVADKAFNPDFTLAAGVQKVQRTHGHAWWEPSSSHHPWSQPLTGLCTWHPGGLRLHREAPVPV
ncbi:hypothetical protein HaLaN_06744 [Haematococcus lacustris]|uniref:Uncharacterized protein n=1 Tax=Haematococcus lacustris TaxID=44745 RepID=A0A699YMM6_HAELA|nr:hypothetical protein HaLaN_06744 [Haematococcus lacustris]